MPRRSARFMTPLAPATTSPRSEEHTSELQLPDHLVCRLLLEKKKSIMQRIFGRVLVKKTARAVEPRNISRREVCFCKRLNFVLIRPFFRFFFFNDTATTEIYTLSLHDALPISTADSSPWYPCAAPGSHPAEAGAADRKSTRLNSSHQIISYAVFCLKKKKN